jgi:3-carboxy-cis,cis-muconate cycloisomerase
MIGISFYNGYWFDGAGIELWDDRATLSRWLEVEAALAKVQANLGIIPAAAAVRISEMCEIDNFDLVELATAIAKAQHPLVPVLDRLEELAGDEHGGWLHWGATTQNIFDTAQALQLKASVGLAQSHLARACRTLAESAVKYGDTLQAGRTHGQHALPITYGFKLVGWLAELHRHASRLDALADHAFVARLGGAVGTYAALDGRGREVEVALANELGIIVPELGGRADFDRQAEVMLALAALAATSERVAADLSFLQRTEIAEVYENHYAERVGSSTMAQKRNPSEAQRVVAMARMTRGRVQMVLEAMVRQDEGDAAATNVTDVLMPDFCVLALSTIKALADLLKNLKPDVDRMRKNLDATGGMISSEAVMMELGRILGRGQAHHILHEATANALANGSTYADEVAAHPGLAGMSNELDLKALLDPGNYRGEVADIITRIVASIELPEKV